MGYSIYIGNGHLTPVEDEEYTTPYSRIIKGTLCYFDMHVEEVTQPDAPEFPNDEMTGKSNGRHPSYSQWGEFCRIAGLEDLFFNEQTGLMREHPGFAVLEEEHLIVTSYAVSQWMEAHPDAVAGFEAFSWNDDAPVVGYDPILARLLWLDYWMNWAFENCEHAGVYNS